MIKQKQNVLSKTNRILFEITVSGTNMFYTVYLIQSQDIYDYACVTGNATAS